jgi:chaperonin GroEL
MYMKDVEGEASARLVVNTLHGSLQCIAVKAPCLGERCRETVRDIAVLMQGQVISGDVGIKLAAGQGCL